MIKRVVFSKAASLCVVVFGFIAIVSFQNCSGGTKFVSTPSSGSIALSSTAPVSNYVPACQPNQPQSCQSISQNGSGTINCQYTGTDAAAFERYIDQNCQINSCNAGYVFDSATQRCVVESCQPLQFAPCNLENGIGRKQCFANGLDYGACIPTTCNAGYAPQNGVCVRINAVVCGPQDRLSCTVGDATGYKTCKADRSGFETACIPENCKPGFTKIFAANQTDFTCVANTCRQGDLRACTDPFGIGTGTQTCNSSGTGFSACVINACPAPTYVFNSQTKSCNFAGCNPGATTSCSERNGTGLRTCSSARVFEGCVLSSCNLGYEGPTAGECRVKPVVTATACNNTGADAVLNTAKTIVCPANCAVQPIFGDQTYTTSSYLCTAAAHAGVISRTNGGSVTYYGTASANNYPSANRNSILSSSSNISSTGFKFSPTVVQNKPVCITPNLTNTAQHCLVDETCPDGRVVNTIDDLNFPITLSGLRASYPSDPTDPNYVNPLVIMRSNIQGDSKFTSGQYSIITWADSLGGPRLAFSCVNGNLQTVESGSCKVRKNLAASDSRCVQQTCTKQPTGKFMISGICDGRGNPGTCNETGGMRQAHAEFASCDVTAAMDSINEPIVNRQFWTSISCTAVYKSTCLASPTCRDVPTGRYIIAGVCNGRGNPGTCNSTGGTRYASVLFTSCDTNAAMDAINEPQANRQFWTTLSCTPEVKRICD